MPYCQKCGAQMAGDSLFCSQCSAASNPPQESQGRSHVSSVRPRTSPLRIFLMAAICVVIVLFSLGWGYWRGLETGTDKGFRDGMLKVKEDEDQTKGTRAIRVVIREDLQLHSFVDTAMKVLTSNTGGEINTMAALVDNYVAQARQIDLSDCPDDFSQAYSKYVSAVGDVSSAFHNHPDTLSEQEARSKEPVRCFFVTKCLDAEGDEKVQAWKNMLRTHLDEMDRAQEEVKRIAAKYGVT